MAETKTATPKLNKDVFNVEVKNHELLKLAYDAYLANSRGANATTLERGEVRGGGKKPWRQKGTGRARFGSSRNPIWRGGGVVFGPRGNENYTKNLSKTMKKVAVKQALSMANKGKKIAVIDTFACPKGKVKETMALFEKYDVTENNRVLLVVSVKDDLVLRATRNVPNLRVVRPNYLNVFDILNADKVLISQRSLPMIDEWLVGGEK
ncbi:MAG: 50S ribosomal protein L4 [Candidatus Nomurabacteria bacterium]|jgi:large subunit ribosomal protein L4|nr:50S ribosomal protein L4 [Candidatus Nomurabacteria bacterium]